MSTTAVSPALAKAQDLYKAAQDKNSPGGYDVTIDEAKGVFAALDAKGSLGATEAKFAIDLYADALGGSDKATIAYAHNYVAKYVEMDDDQRKNFMSDLIGDAYTAVDTDDYKNIKEVSLTGLPAQLRSALSAEKTKQAKADPKADVKVYEMRLGENDKTIVGYVVQSISPSDDNSDAGTVTTFNPAGKKLDSWDDVEC